MDAVRRRIEADFHRAQRFELHPHREEIVDIEARLVASGVPIVRRCLTDMALLLGVGYESFVKWMNGSKTLPMDVIAAMKWASRRVPEARDWCVAVARELLPEGWTITPPPEHRDAVQLVGDVDQGASALAAQTIRALADGHYTAGEAAAQLPAVRELRAQVTALEADLALRAAGVAEGGRQ